MINLAALCADFTQASTQTRQQSRILIGQLYTQLSSPSAQTAAIFAGWQQEFAYLYGRVGEGQSSNQRLRAAQMLQDYQIGCRPADTECAVQRLIFAMQTYYSLLLKCILRQMLDRADDNRDIEDLVRGGFAERAGVCNYATQDWYLWPIYEARQSIVAVIEEICTMLARYRGQAAESAQRDALWQLYEALLPDALRHALGEYYTPPWVVEQVTDEVCARCKTDIKALRLIDPTCGAGNFLTCAIAKKRAAGAGLSEICDTVCGIDINPLAVCAAKTSYILSALDLLDPDRPIAIPIYCADALRLREEIDERETEGLPVLQAIAQDRRRDRVAARALSDFDAVVGNPPWVSWEYLPEDYRRCTQHRWQDYHLIRARGRALSFLKEDIAALLTYVAIDELLRQGGVLGFVLRQGLFKSAQNGAGFRRFCIGENMPIGVLRVDDLSALRVFGKTCCDAALFYAKKGEKTDYPIDFYVWQGKARYKRQGDTPKDLVCHRQAAVPAVPQDLTSVWLTGASADLLTIQQFLGTNEYRARTGVFTGGANAVYWLQVHEDRGDCIVVQNQTRRAKRSVPCVQAELEKTYVYPMLRGGQIRQWQTDYDTYLLCPHTAQTRLRPVPQQSLQAEAPKTLAYLQGFRAVLDSRRGFAGWERQIQREEFHAVLRVGAYTFAPYKVVWRYIASRFVCAVIGTVEDEFLGTKLLLPNEKVMFVGFDKAEPAYYLCGLLSASAMVAAVQGFMNPTSISAHVLNKLNIPTFDAQNPVHREIAALCRAGHNSGQAAPYLAQIDRLAAQIYI